MSEDFFGRPISKGMDALEFDLCEICQRRTPTKLEVEYEDNIPAVRFACEECHEEYMQSKNKPKPEIARQISDKEELPEATRSGWVEDFIKEQQDSGTIENIDSQPVADETETSSSEIGFSEAPETFQQSDEAGEEEEYKPQQIAGWAPKFIQEALFGPNPEGWLDENGAYKEEVIDITTRTLGSFADHDVTAVKLSAIQCLLGLYNRHPSKQEEVISHLKKYRDDPDETINEFAKQTMDQIQ